MKTITTTDLGHFNATDLKTAGELLTALGKELENVDRCGYILDGRLSIGGLALMKNMQSGWVFLTNSEYEVAILGPDGLEKWYSLPWSGDEGTVDDLRELFLSSGSEMALEDVEYLRDNGIISDGEFCAFLDSKNEADIE